MLLVSLFTMSIRLLNEACFIREQTFKHTVCA
ncbi:hypothetical protein DSM14862_03268 (plasmid) [Sulfitobacter indolifex]|nr:hypothetical protein DSM14862_03268 [Sulfitobacter indolifex]